MLQKKNKKRIFQRLLALVLVTALLWQTDSMRFFSSTVYAAEIADGTDITLETQDSLEIDEKETGPVMVLGEVESLRGENEKHFRMSDGTFMAVSYGVPIHYQDTSGDWQEINNELSLSADGESYVTADMNRMDISSSFAKDLSSGELLEVTNGSTAVSMGLLDTMEMITIPSSGIQTFGLSGFDVLPGPDLEEMQVLERFDRTVEGDITYETNSLLGMNQDTDEAEDTTKGYRMEDLIPSTLQDSIRYADVFSGVDLVYTRFSNDIKEEIVVKEQKDSYRYDFALNLTGVTPVLMEDGSIYLVNEAGEVYYEIPAPFMEDANGIKSFDVTYDITAIGDGYKLSVIVDEDWMNDEERAFPVVIDPTIHMVAGDLREDIFIIFVTKGTPNVSYQGQIDIGYTNYNSTKDHESYLHFDRLPTIPDGMTVVKADFSLYEEIYSQVACAQMGVGFYEVTGSKPSDVGYYDWIRTLTWNTKPAIKTSNMIDYVMTSASTVNQYNSWEITELVKKWYAEGTENRTAALTMVPDACTTSSYAMASFSAFQNTTGYPPILTVSYRSTVGLEPYYTYQSLGLGNAGTAYIADATGQLKVVKGLVSYASTINPFSLNLVYNSDYFANKSGSDPSINGKISAQSGVGSIAMSIGQGWTLDIIQTLKVENIAGPGQSTATKYLCYRDGDGTRHYFATDAEKNSKETISGTFYYDEDGLGLKAKITNTAETSFIMYDEKGNSWTFTSNRLVSYKDETGNSYQINWVSNRISSIVQKNKGQSTGIQVAGFTYSGNTLSTITDAAGNVWTFGYTGEKMTSLSYNDEVVADYGYTTTTNYINRIKDSIADYEMRFTYKKWRVSTYREWGEGIQGDGVSIQYPNYSKTIYQSSGQDHILGGDSTDDIYTIYLFDYAGRTINAYTTDKQNNLLGATNAVYYGDYSASSDEKPKENGVDRKVNLTRKIGSMGMANPTLFHFGECENTGWTFPTLPSGQTAAYTATLDNRRTGAYGLLMTSTVTTASSFASSTSVALTKGKTYTFSAYVNTSDLTSISGNGIRLKVTDSAGNSFLSEAFTRITSEAIEGGWTRIQMTFTAKTAGTHTLYIHGTNVKGTFYVDDLQLEEGTVAGTLNLLVNGSFDTVPKGWAGYNGAGYLNSKGWNSSTAMRILGDPEMEAYIRQNVPIMLPATETFVLSGWGKANSVPDNVNYHTDPLQDIDKQFGLRARIQYTDDTIEYHYAAFNPDVSDWQFLSLTIVPKQPTKTIETIRVIVTYEGNANVAYFDNICLSREVAQTMKYDEDGNLESVTSTGQGTDKNTYENGVLDKTVTSGSGTYDYTYDTTYEHRLTAVTGNFMKQSLGYDSYGNVTTSTLTASAGSAASIVTSSSYTNQGNLLHTVTDAVGNTATYSYREALNLMYGLPSMVIDGKGNATLTTYDSYGRTLTVEDENENLLVSYLYEQDVLREIIRTGAEGESLSYEFFYDEFRNVTEIQVEGTPLVTYSYESGNGHLIRMTYGNGDYVTYDYDFLGRLKQEKHYNGDGESAPERTIDYVYDSNGQVYSITETIGGSPYHTYYSYDTIGRLIYSRQTEAKVETKYTYDNNNRLVRADYVVDGWGSFYETYSYNASKTDSIPDGVLTQMRMLTGKVIKPELDALQRLKKRTVANILVENYSYQPGIQSGSTTTLVNGKQNVVGGVIKNNFAYTYDQNGNILSVTDSTTGYGVTYSYDSLNQLTDATYSDGRVEIYSYDSAGNLLSFNNGETSHTYSYESDWTDLLTAVDGLEITYDDIGNPLSYYNGDNYNFTWTEGRRLVSVTVNGNTTTYEYNAEGIRIRKIFSDRSYIQYILVGSTIIGEKHYSATNTLTKQLRYTFDENGTICGYSVSTNGSSWTEYYFVRNLQGDILQVIDTSGNVKATYSYDSWGNILSQSGDNASENPFRYRGYYYDEGTAFYYVSSRYYDPEIGRFINADDVSMLGANGDFASLNLYAYCGNNPVMRADSCGEAWHIVIGALVGAVAGLVGQVLSDVVTSTLNGQVTISNWQTYTGAIIGGAAGGVVMAATGNVAIANAVTGAVTTGVGQSLEKLTIEDYDKSWGEIAINTAVDGAVSYGLGKLPGLQGATAGRNSWSATFKSGLTKLKNGTASQMSVKVICKGVGSFIVGGFAMDGYYGIKQHAYDRTKTQLLN